MGDVCDFDQFVQVMSTRQLIKTLAQPKRPQVGKLCQIFIMTSIITMMPTPNMRAIVIIRKHRANHRKHSKLASHGTNN